MKKDKTAVQFIEDFIMDNYEVLSGDKSELNKSLLKNLFDKAIVIEKGQIQVSYIRGNSQPHDDIKLVWLAEEYYKNNYGR